LLGPPMNQDLDRAKRRCRAAGSSSTAAMSPALTRRFANFRCLTTLLSRSMRLLLPVAFLGAVLLPQPALAHITQGPIGGFAGGFAHPLTGLDHFLAMFAVGVWGAQMGGRSVWMLPVAFPLVMTVGGIAGMAGLVLPYVEIGIALSILVLGLA